jgi:hypothetical protein
MGHASRGCGHALGRAWRNPARPRAINGSESLIIGLSHSVGERSVWVRRRSDIVVKAFLIGAGATKAQYPTAPLSRDFLSKIDPPLLKAINKVAKPLVSSDITNYSIEDIMFLAGSLVKSQKDYFLTNINLAIHDVITRTTFNDEITKYPRGPETTFKTLLRDDRLEPDDFFLTLNYDLCLDREIYSIQNSIDYGLIKNVINHSDIHQEEGRFSLYHLHGSLNWQIMANGKLDILTQAFEPRHDRAGSNLCLAPPGLKNLNEILQILWLTVERKIETADELIIIGCSLDTQDHELLRLLYRLKEKNVKVKIIHLAEDKNSGYYDNYQEVFEDDFEDYPYGFFVESPFDDLQGGAIEFIFDNLDD